MQKELHYFEGLNGIRAIACLVVLFSHVNKVVSSIIPQSNITFASNGANGVTMFFVLSGFLITFKIYNEEFITWRSLMKFYIRRALRILPLYYLYILICLSVYWIYRPELVNYDVLPFYLLLMPNIPWILSIGIPNLSHYWSLGVEEQFYIVWPFFIKLFFNNLLSLSIFVLALLLCFKIYLLSFEQTDFISSLIYALGFQHILVGCIGAILYLRFQNVIIKFFCNKIIQVISWFLFVLLFTITRQFSFKPELFGLLTLFIIYGQINVKNRVLNLENYYLNKIGIFSFGIYVYHPLIINFVKIITANLVIVFTPLVYGIIFYLLTIVVTLSTAYLSYHYYESIFLRLKGKYY